MKGDRITTKRLLNTARGQIEGIIKMVEENRYCIDISNQIMACQAILTKVNREGLRAHLENCVIDACGEQGKEKINEIAQVLEKLL